MIDNGLTNIFPILKVIFQALDWPYKNNDAPVSTSMQIDYDATDTETQAALLENIQQRARETNTNAIVYLKTIRHQQSLLIILMGRTMFRVEFDVEFGMLPANKCMLQEAKRTEEELNCLCNDLFGSMPLNLQSSLKRCDRMESKLVGGMGTLCEICKQRCATYEASVMHTYSKRNIEFVHMHRLLQSSYGITLGTRINRLAGENIVNETDNNDDLSRIITETSFLAEVHINKLFIRLFLFLV